MGWEPTDEEVEREAFNLAGPGPYHPKVAEEIRAWARAHLIEVKESGGQAAQ